MARTEETTKGTRIRCLVLVVFMVAAMSLWENSFFSAVIENANQGMVGIAKVNKTTIFGTSLRNESSNALEESKGKSKIPLDSQKKQDSKGLSIVVELSSSSLRQDSLGAALSRLAFAKMLEVEAKERHNLNVSIRIVQTEPESPLSSSCFPALDSLSVVDRDVLTARQRQQQEWLGDKAVLLEPTIDVWEEALSLLTKTTTPPKDTGATKMDNILPLPFLYLPSSLSDLPLLYQYTGMKNIVNFLTLDQSPTCCPMNPPLPSDNVLYMDEGLSLDSVVPLFVNYTKWDRVVVVTDRIENNATDFKALQNNGLVVRSVHEATIRAESQLSRFCFLLQTQQELLGPLDAPFAFWAALTSHNASSVRLFSDQAAPSYRHFSEEDPRSSLVIQSLKNENPLVSEESPSSSKGSKDVVDGPRVGTPDRPVIIVNQLSGEMGNQLAKIGYGLGLELWLKDDYNITAVTLFQHQEKPKWVRAMQSVKACFPRLRSRDFSAANTPEFEQRWREQQRWLGDDAEKLHMHFTESREEIVERLEFLKSILDRPTPPIKEENATIWFPFIYAATFAMYNVVSDRYHQDLKEFFEYDYENPLCCNQTAEPDETVFVSSSSGDEIVMLFTVLTRLFLFCKHLRNYVKEMPRRGARLGFEELSPNKTANELLKNKKKGDKIVFTNRFSREEVAPYLDAIEQRGLVGRAVEGQNSHQDFCFLMSAQEEMIGIAKSSFSLWAAFLGNATNVRLYSMRSPARREALGDDNLFEKYDFEHPALRDRFHFELYNSEAQDEEDGKVNDTIARFRL